jgi:hypothetical protein
MMLREESLEALEELVVADDAVATADDTTAGDTTADDTSVDDISSDVDADNAELFLRFTCAWNFGSPASGT